MKILYHGARNPSKTSCDCKICVESAKTEANNPILVSAFPPSRRTIRSDIPKKNYFISFPWTILAIRYRPDGNKFNFLSLWAFGANKEPQTLRDTVFPLILPNTDWDGCVCLGFHDPIVTTSPESLIHEASSRYYGSYFNGTATGFLCRKGIPIDLERLQKEPDALLKVQEQQSLKHYLLNIE